MSALSTGLRATSRVFSSIAAWFDHNRLPEARETLDSDAVEWPRAIPFVALHAALLAVPFVGISVTAVVICALSYFVRMFAITGWFHRYFSHRTFKTSRFMQFVWSVIGGAAAQRGALWWAAHHRHHHKFSDGERDPHSPVQHSFLYSHMLWFMTRRHFSTDESVVRDLVRYPELRFLNRFDGLVAIGFGVSMYGFGAVVTALFPELGTSAMQIFVWGFVVSTILLFHATATINSFGHLIGSKRFDTGDESRNNWFLALITLGEGWHNNHHFYPVATRQGFKWWEVDVAYYGLWLMERVGLVWDLRPVPRHVHDGHRVPPRSVLQPGASN